MRYFTSILCFACVCLISTARGQQSNPQEKQRYILMPPEQALLTVASQPDCPLKFEATKYLFYIDRGQAFRFQLYNQGTKAIRGYTIAAAGVDEETWQARSPKEFIMPGKRLSESASNDSELVPLTAELRGKLKLRGPMQAVVVLIVVRVEYADGSVYDDEQTYKALRAYSMSAEAKW